MAFNQTLVQTAGEVANTRDINQGIGAATSAGLQAGYDFSRGIIEDEQADELHELNVENTRIANETAQFELDVDRETLENKNMAMDESMNNAINDGRVNIDGQNKEAYGITETSIKEMAKNLKNPEWSNQDSALMLEHYNSFVSTLPGVENKFIQSYDKNATSAAPGSPEWTVYNAIRSEGKGGTKSFDYDSKGNKASVTYKFTDPEGKVHKVTKDINTLDSMAGLGDTRRKATVASAAASPAGNDEAKFMANIAQNQTLKDDLLANIANNPAFKDPTEVER